ncbi:MAG: NAD(P)/FAD-dependent oxidoreductase [Bacilli bacterium]
MKICVIGGGPFGILSAISIKKNNPFYDVVLLEKNESIGSRIKVSGNGRCNFYNANLNEKKFSSPLFVKKLISLKDKLFSLLDEVGLSYYYDEEGRYYPLSESSSTIIYCLNKLLSTYQVKVKTNFKVERISKENNKYIVSSLLEKEEADKLVIGIGGISFNNDRINYNNIIHLLNINTTRLTPSLTPISTSSFSLRLEGKRRYCNVKLLKGNNIVKEEKGEVLFKKNGVSGIVIFNMSSYLARLHLSSYSSYTLSFDLCPSLNDEELKELISKDASLRNIFISEIADYVLSLGKNSFENIRNLKLEVKDLYEFKNSQVTSGGIDLNEINDDFSLKNDKNIFVGGEMIDIDGECGGYNIGIALLSGIYVGDVI